MSYDEHLISQAGGDGDTVPCPEFHCAQDANHKGGHVCGKADCAVYPVRAGGDGEETSREIANRVGKRYAHLYQLLRDELQANAWDEGVTSGWNQSGEGWNAEYPDESTGRCSVDKSRNPYRKAAK